jgi:hypothetical protein
MKKQLVTIGTLALLVCVGLSGCNQTSNTINPDKDKFIGTWKTTSGSPPAIVYITFFSNGSGSGSAYNSSFTWLIKNGNITFKNNRVTESCAYSFSNNDKTLTLIVSSGEKIIFTKQ